MFGDALLGYSWLDGAFFNVLRYIDRFYVYFYSQCRGIAMICFALAFGIGCVKLIMGGTELNKFFTQMFMSVCVYFIMLWIFPSLMIGMNKIVGNLAHGAIFSFPVDMKYDSKYGGTPDQFYEYMNKIGTWGGDEKALKAGETIWRVSKNRIGGEYFLDLRITNAGTGLISLNKTFLMMLGTFGGIWRTYGSMFNTDSILTAVVSFFKHFPDLIMVILISLVYAFTFCVAIVNYTMKVVQFCFLYGIGVMFIPLMLWDGVKHAFEKLCGGIFNIAVHLLISQIVLYLIVIVNFDILKNMYILSNGNHDFLLGLEFYLSILFLCVFCKVFNDQTASIADFLCGGQPRLSVGEFMQAAASVGAAGAAALGAGKAIAGGTASTLAGGVGALAAAREAGKGAQQTELDAGSSKSVARAAGWQAFKSSMGGSLKNGAATALDNGIKAVGNAPGALKSGAQLMRYGIAPNAPLSAEGIGLSPRNPFGGGRGGGGGGEGGAGSEKSKETAERLLKSKNASERLEGAKLHASNLRASGGEYSGVKGRFKAMASGFDKLKSSNSEQAPGEWKKSDRVRLREMRAEDEAKAKAAASGGGETQNSGK